MLLSLSARAEGMRAEALVTHGRHHLPRGALALEKRRGPTRTRQSPPADIEGSDGTTDGEGIDIQRDSLVHLGHDSPKRSHNTRARKQPKEKRGWRRRDADIAHRHDGSGAEITYVNQ
jgi:hypothetical protein